MLHPPPPADLTFLWRLVMAVAAWKIVTWTRKPDRKRPWNRDWLLPFSLLMSFVFWPWLWRH